MDSSVFCGSKKTFVNGDGIFSLVTYLHWKVYSEIHKSQQVVRCFMQVNVALPNKAKGEKLAFRKLVSFCLVQLRLYSTVLVTRAGA